MPSNGIIIRDKGEGDMRWFFGGGLHTWKATAAETNGGFLCFEDHMSQGKMTPLHTHPDADEIFYVLEGAIVFHSDGVNQHVNTGGFVVALRGVPHAFMATAETRVLCVQTPGTGQEFFNHASQPITEDNIDGPVDFSKVNEAAEKYGGVAIIGQPPFKDS